MEDSASTGPSASQNAGLSDPGRWVEEYGDYLFRYALMRLRDPSRAEDMVQETFLAALKGGRSFAGRSAEKTWLVGILKNKIADYFRKASRETSFTDLNFYQGEEAEQFVAEGLGEEAGFTRWDRRTGRRIREPVSTTRRFGRRSRNARRSCQKTSAPLSPCGKLTTSARRRFVRCSIFPEKATCG